MVPRADLPPSATLERYLLGIPAVASKSWQEEELRLGRGPIMAYGIVHFFAGGTKEQYEASIAAVHPNRSTLPKGQVYHAAGPSAGGWTVIAIHDSEASWERFRDDILMPRLKQGVKGGFTSPPQEQVFEVYNMRP